MVWVETVVGSLISASLQVLFDRIATWEFIERFKVLDDKLLKKLRITLLSVNALLDDAEEKQITNVAVKEWLDELQDAVYRAEDLCDKIATEDLRCQLERVRSPWVKSPFTDGIKGDVENIIKDLEYIAERKDRLGLKESVGGKRSQRFPTTSLVNECDVCGRTEDKDVIISSLGSDDACGNEICVITLVGMGGIGKTTLAQLVYNEIENFDLKAWACVSEEFDVLRVAKTILEAVTKSTCDIEDLNLIQVKLKQRLERKKFLLVLDDVWNENYIDWDVLRSPFRNAARGSKIIVTTRNESVASIMRSCHTHRLKELPPDQCWRLFERHAFKNGESVAHPNLVAIAEKIVKKCNGLPLAAKTLGGLLYSKVEAEEWADILNSEIWDLPKGKSNILPALRLSYYYLPSHLKRCFAYCSIFPKRNEFKKDELILLWMAEGFLLPNSKKRLEEVGDEYFRELFSRSFFQQSTRNESCFIMHDLVNDLAQFVSGEFCLKLEDGKLPKVSKKARHFGYSRNKYDVHKIIDAVVYKDSLLRTFLPSNFPYPQARCYLNPKCLDDLLEKLRWLRVLSLSDYWTDTKLSDEIGNLKHLHYLNLSRTKIERLPDTTSSLYNLQTLMLSGCSALIELPSNMGNLINLRYLDISGTGLTEMPMEFSNLTSLQTLSTFLVSGDSGSRISELGGFLHLHGTLTISKLQNVVGANYASEANLKNMECLEKLVFEWDTGCAGLVNVEDVLDKLLPHKNLKGLTINHYCGTRFPNWLNDSVSRLTSLETLEILDCNNLQSMPPESLPNSLSYLTIRSCSLLKPRCQRTGQDWDKISHILNIKIDGVTI